MSNHLIKKLENLGQSIWLDYIRRDLISVGKLKQLIEDDGLSGMTSNPSIRALTYSQGCVSLGWIICRIGINSFKCQECQIQKSVDVGIGILVCPCHPATCFGYIEW